MQIIALNKQSLPDLAIQELGSLEAVMALSIKNDIPVSAELEVGQVITYDVAKPTRVVAYLRAQGVKPATGLSSADLGTAPSGGIGFMAIEIDFIVS